MGPIQADVHLNTSMHLVLSQIDDIKISQLWDLESNGIRDPIEVKSIGERNFQTNQHFLQTVSSKYQTILG